MVNQCVVQHHLRLREGVSLERLGEEAGRDWREMIERRRVDALAAEGMIELDETALRPTPAGMQRLNAMLGYLLA